MTKLIPLLLLVSLATPAYTAPEPAIATPPLATLATAEEQLHCKNAGIEINYWAKRMKLKDWAITLYCDIPNIPEWQNSFVHGASSFDITTRTANVWINPKSNRTPREIVIHELLHLIVAEVREAKSNLIEERAVWMLAEIIHEGK